MSKENIAENILVLIFGERRDVLQVICKYNLKHLDKIKF